MGRCGIGLVYVVLNVLNVMVLVYVVLKLYIHENFSNSIVNHETPQRMRDEVANSKCRTKK